jgi:hypothetical protein
MYVCVTWIESALLIGLSSSNKQNSALLKVAKKIIQTVKDRAANKKR